MTNQTVSSIKHERNVAVSAAVASIRDIESKHGVDRDSLEKIMAVLLDLVSMQNLFPESDFSAVANEKGMFPLYRVSEEEDHSLAMYVNSSLGDNDVPPHNHTTWAVTVSIKGTEENRLYERTDDGSQPGKSQLKQFNTITVAPGTGICMMPDDIHSVHARNNEAALILHMYGKALDHLPQRTNYNLEAGTYRVAVPQLFIVDAR